MHLLWWLIEFAFVFCIHYHSLRFVCLKEGCETIFPWKLSNELFSDWFRITDLPLHSLPSSLFHTLLHFAFPIRTQNNRYNGSASDALGWVPTETIPLVMVLLLFNPNRCILISRSSSLFTPATARNALRMRLCSSAISDALLVALSIIVIILLLLWFHRLTNSRQCSSWAAWQQWKLSHDLIVSSTTSRVVSERLFCVVPWQ